MPCFWYHIPPKDCHHPTFSQSRQWDVYHLAEMYCPPWHPEDYFRWFAISMPECQTTLTPSFWKDVWPQGDLSSHQLASTLEKEVGLSYPIWSFNRITFNLSLQPCGIYAGFDPTASSLHVGNLLILVRREEITRGKFKSPGWTFTLPTSWSPGGGTTRGSNSTDWGP